MIPGSESWVIVPGLTLPFAPWRLYWDLMARGCHIQVDGDDLVVGPRRLLSHEDYEALKRWKPHLRAIVGYDAEAERRQQ